MDNKTVLRGLLVDCALDARAHGRMMVALVDFGAGERGEIVDIARSVPTLVEKVYAEVKDFDDIPKWWYSTPFGVAVIRLTDEAVDHLKVVEPQPESVCASCGASLVWKLTAAGKKMPLDAKLKRRWCVREDNPDVVEMVDSYDPHWVSCPGAVKHRRTR